MPNQFPFVSKFDATLSLSLLIPSQSQPHNTLHITHLCKRIIQVHTTPSMCELNQKLEEKVQAQKSQNPLSKWLFYYHLCFFIYMPTTTSTIPLVTTNVVTSKKHTTVAITLLCLVHVKYFPENKYFPEMLFSEKENIFKCLVAFQKMLWKIFSSVWL